MSGGGEKSRCADKAGSQGGFDADSRPDNNLTRSALRRKLLGFELRQGFFDAVGFTDYWGDFGWRQGLYVPAVTQALDDPFGKNQLVPFFHQDGDMLIDFRDPLTNTTVIQTAAHG
jgi:hypothetical protein